MMLLFCFQKKFYHNNIKFFSMDTFLHKSKHFFIVLLFVFCGKMSAQCTITGSVLSSTQTCSSFSTCPIINIGDGVNPTTLILDKNLDLTGCSLGAVQIIVNSNSNIDFSDQNYDLRLPAGSSITFNETGTLISPGGCSGSDRIIIGGNVIATCLGSGPPFSFSELVAQGGYSSINASASPTSVCGSGSFVLTATANPSTGATYNWYLSASGGVSVHTGATYNTGSISSTTKYYVEASYTSPTAYTTIRKSVTATVNSLPVAAGTIVGTATVCQGQSSVGYSVSVISNATSYTWVYSGSGATITSTINAATITFAANATSGNLKVYGVNACGNGTISANYAITVNPNLPTSVSIAASPSGAICLGTAITFTATPTNGGGTPVYQWKLNGVDVGTNSAIYTNSTLANGDSITCVMASNATPCVTGSPATSNVVVMAVDPITTLTEASQATPACVGSGAIINLTGLLASSTSTLNYTINGVSQTDVAGVVANASGVASFTTSVLTATNNGQTLQVTGITTTSKISNCGVSFTQNVILSVSPASVGGSVSGSQTTICVNTTTGTLILGSGYVGTIVQWEKRLGSGSWATIANTTTTYSESPAVAGVWEYRALVQSGICPVVYSSSFAVTVESGIPIAPVLTDIVLACNQTAVTGTWAAVANAVNYKFDVSLDPSFGTFLSGYQDISVAPTASPSVVVNGLTPGATYYVRARAINSCGTASVNSNIGTVSVAVTKTSNGSSWDNGIPDSSKKVIFTGNSTLSSSLNACSCQINSGAAVQVDSGIVMKLENELTVVGTGTLTFENNASLVQVNDEAVNTGTIIYKRNATPMKNYDYTYWSSPVAGQTLKALSPNTLLDKYFSFSMNNWVTELNGLSTMIAGKGYIIRVPKPDVLFPNGEYWTGTTYVQSVEFKGIPNNGVYSLPIDPVGYNNLIGNPYPCAMSADAFLLENSINNPRLEGTIYFWTHNTAIANGRYSGTDFASYNYLGGVGIVAAASGSAGGANTSIPSGYIAAGQSFMTTSAGGAEPVVFNNGMRVGLTNKNAQFFKGAQSKTVPIEKHRVWLSLTNSEGAFKQMLLGYVTGATNGFDSAFDGVSLDSNKYIDFYSVNDNKNFVIQGRALPFEKTDKVPLGYKTSIEGTFAISIDQVDGVLANQTIFVEDKVANVIHNLKNGAYSFSTLKGVFNDRFVLRYTDNSVVVEDPIVAVPVVTNTVVLDSVLGGGTVLGTDSFDAKGRSIIVSAKDHVKINSFDGTIAKIMIYDLRGRLLYQNVQVNKSEFVIQNLNLTKQILIVVTVLSNGTMQSNEIIF
jgi:hypothetical protein